MLWQLKHPFMLWGIIPLALLVYMMFRQGRRFPGTFSFRRTLLYTVGLGCCLLGLSRPQMGRQVATERGAGNNVFLAVDISQSMMVEDLLPNRLVFSTTVMQQLLPEIAGARIALFPFAADGYIQVPLSYDSELIHSMLPALGPSLTSDQGTDFSQSLETLHNLIRKLEAKSIERGEKWLPTQVLLFSDGETHEEVSTSILAKFQNSGIPVFTVGTATSTGAPVPANTVFGGTTNYMRDTAGQVVTSRLNRESLRTIAELTGGEYFDGNFRSLRKLATKLNRSTRLSKVKTALKVEREFYPWLFLAALMLLLTEFSFGRWQYAIRVWIPVLLIPSFAMADVEADLQTKLKKSRDSEERSILTYNLGTVYREKKDHEKAAEFFQEAAYLSQNKLNKKKALFNAGNALLKSGHPKEAIEKYQEAYDLPTGDEDFDQPTNKKLEENIELAARVLEQAQKQQQQRDGEGEGKPNESNDPKGPKNDYMARQFSRLRKRRIFDLLADKEQETLKRLRKKRNRGEASPFAGKQW